MFDDLRAASDEPEYSDDAYEASYDSYDYGSETLYIGMTAPQRLIISILLFATVIVIGSMCLVVTERFWFF